jgi:hypothetical protein
VEAEAEAEAEVEAEAEAEAVELVLEAAEAVGQDLAAGSQQCHPFHPRRRARLARSMLRTTRCRMP